MASVHRIARRRSPYWIGSFRDANGKWRLRSTKCTSKKDAELICQAWEETAINLRLGRLTPDKARDLISDNMAKVMLASGNTDAFKGSTVRTWATAWLNKNQLENAPATHARYRDVVRRLIDWLGPRADKLMDCITRSDLSAFRDQIAKELSISTANLFVKIVRTFFNDAVREGLLTTSPGHYLETLRRKEESNRRPFTLAEIRRVLNACNDPEWRGMVLFGLYCGQRLGDLARLTWRAINLETKTISFVTGKTGRRIHLPMAKPLEDYLTELSPTDNPNAPLFPKAAQVAAIRVGTLSNQFHEILVDAGLAVPRPHEKAAEGRNATRPTSDLTFHSLRHSATTLLKAAGVSDAIAAAIIGHDSALINQHYTHLEAEHLRSAIDSLPDITKPAEPKHPKPKL